MKILQIKSAITGEHSLSNIYAEKLLHILNKNSANEIRVRDLESNPVTQLTEKNLVELQNESSEVYNEHLSLINEIKEAEVVIIAAPMYNFAIPVSLKAYFDAISKNGLTFKYGEDGNPVGFLKDKKTYVILSRGGKYKDANLTFQEDYLKLQLAFIGLDNVDFIFVEGSAMGVPLEEIDNSFEQQLKEIIK